MNTLKNILVAVDFSPGARAALAQAVRLADINGAALHVLHVVDKAAVATMAKHRGESYERQALESEESAKAALTKWLAISGVPANSAVSVRVGVPLHEILEHEGSLKPDLLVAGIEGAHGAKAGAGSVSAKIARKAKSPALLVRADHPHAFKHIVACIDVADSAHEIAKQAHRVAVQDSAKVDFLHIWHAPWTAMPYMVPLAAMPAELPPDYVENFQKALVGFVGEDAQGIEATEVLRESPNHAEGIAEHAEEVGADLIVIGAKGRTNLRYVLLGSTAEQVLTRLPCSLLVIKPAAE